MDLKLLTLLYHQRTKITPEAKPSIRRNFMQNSMEQYLEVMKQTNTEMAKELDRMPIGKFQLVLKIVVCIVLFFACSASIASSQVHRPAVA